MNLTPVWTSRCPAVAGSPPAAPSRGCGMAQRVGTVALLRAHDGVEPQCTIPTRFLAPMHAPRWSLRPSGARTSRRLIPTSPGPSG
jgi:hypothetical protein